VRESSEENFVTWTSTTQVQQTQVPIPQTLAGRGAWRRVDSLHTWLSKSDLYHTHDKKPWRKAIHE